jgi:hypothetical protein
MTQKQFVINQLEAKGEISRNLCLNNRITRLAAIINNLKKKGWEFKEDRINGDYIYYIKAKPTTSNLVKELREWRESQVENKQDKLI